MLLDHGAYLLARLVVRGDRAADGHPTGFRDLCRDESDPQHVRDAVRPTESQPLGEMVANDVAVEQAHRTTLVLHQSYRERAGHRRLAGAGQAAQQDGEPRTAARPVNQLELGRDGGLGRPGGKRGTVSHQFIELRR